MMTPKPEFKSTKSYLTYIVCSHIIFMTFHMMTFQVTFHDPFIHKWCTAWPLALHPPGVAVQLGGEQNLQGLSLGHLMQVSLAAAFPEKETAGSWVGYGWIWLDT